VGAGRGLDIPINGLFVMALTLLTGRCAGAVRSRWGLRVRATVQPRRWPTPAASTPRTDRLTFAIGCGIAGVAGAAFTTIGSTGPPAARSTSSTPSWW
jgi:urea transport system permease protein